MKFRLLLFCVAVCLANLAHGEPKKDDRLRIQRNLKMGGTQSYELVCVSDASCRLVKSQGSIVIKEKNIKGGKAIIERFSRDIASFARAPNGPVPPETPTFEWQSQNGGNNLSGHTVFDKNNREEIKTL